MIPSAIERKAGLGTIKIEASEARTVKAEKATALPAVAKVSATESTTAALSRGATSTLLARAARNRTTRKSE
jgi:hypothetical protein